MRPNTAIRGPAATVEQRTISKILDELLDHELQARRVLNMAPSENVMSGLAKIPLILDVYHRYFFNETGDGDHWHFRAAQPIGALEGEVVLPLVRALIGAQFATVRPLSGLSAMTVVLAALGGNTGDRVITLAPDLGGHYATAPIARRFGLDVHHMTGPDPHTVDLEALEQQVRGLRPQLVYIDQSHGLFPVDVRALSSAVKRANEDTLLHVDVSHWLGLVLGGQVPNPLERGADSVSGSTHKTMPGPQKALIATNRSDVAKRVTDAQEFLVSSHHFAAVLSLGLALLEFRSFGSDYAAAIIANAQTLGAELHARGLPVAAEHRGFSGGHQLWLDIEQLGISARDASERLFATGIRVNFLPDMPGFGPREAIRLGVNEATYHGLRPGEMATLGAVMSAAIRAEESPEVLRATVEALRESTSQRGESIPGPSQDLLDKAMRLCAAALTSCYQDVDGALEELTNPTAHQLTGGGA